MKKHHQMATLFAALADPTRLRLINLLQEGEICVCYFVELFGQPQPKISRHLAFLKRAGLVEARREGRWIFYRMADLPADQAQVVSAAMEGLRDDAALSKDREQLEQVCCGVRVPRALQDAPVPVLAPRR